MTKCPFYPCKLGCVPKCFLTYTSISRYIINVYYSSFYKHWIMLITVAVWRVIMI